MARWMVFGNAEQDLTIGGAWYYDLEVNDNWIVVEKL